MIVALVTASLIAGASPFAAADAAYAAGKFDRAEPLYRESLASKAALKAPDRGDALNRFSQCLRKRGDYAETLSVARDALALNQNSSPISRQTRESLVIVGDVLLRLGRKDEGIAKLREALVVSNKLQAAGVKSDGTAELTLGRALAHNGQIEEGLSLIEAAEPLTAAFAGRDSILFALVFVAKGQAKYLQGDYASAESNFRAALPTYRKVYGTAHPETVSTEGDLATALQKQGRLADAEPLATHAAEETERQLGAHPSTATFLYNLAVLKRDLNKRAEAVDLFKRALQMANKIGMQNVSAAAQAQLNKLTGE